MKTIPAILIGFIIGALVVNYLCYFKPIRIAFSGSFGINRCMTGEQVRKLSESKVVLLTIKHGGIIEVK